jgi:hypothetical protein
MAQVHEVPHLALIATPPQPHFQFCSISEGATSREVKVRVTAVARRIESELPAKHPTAQVDAGNHGVLGAPWGMRAAEPDRAARVSRDREPA